jgi:hypothetical protein
MSSGSSTPLPKTRVKTNEQEQQSPRMANQAELARRNVEVAMDLEVFQDIHMKSSRISHQATFIVNTAARREAVLQGTGKKVEQLENYMDNLKDKVPKPENLDEVANFDKEYLIYQAILVELKDVLKGDQRSFEYIQRKGTRILKDSKKIIKTIEDKVFRKSQAIAKLKEELLKAMATLGMEEKTIDRNYFAINPLQESFKEFVLCINFWVLPYSAAQNRTAFYCSTCNFILFCKMTNIKEDKRPQMIRLVDLFYLPDDNADFDLIKKQFIRNLPVPKRLLTEDERQAAQEQLFRKMPMPMVIIPGGMGDGEEKAFYHSCRPTVPRETRNPQAPNPAREPQPRVPKARAARTRSAEAPPGNDSGVPAGSNQNTQPAQPPGQTNPAGRRAAGNRASRITPEGAPEPQPDEGVPHSLQCTLYRDRLVINPGQLIGFPTFRCYLTHQPFDDKAVEHYYKMPLYSVEFLPSGLPRRGRE